MSVVIPCLIVARLIIESLLSSVRPLNCLAMSHVVDSSCLGLEFVAKSFCLDKSIVRFNPIRTRNPT